MMSKTTVMAIIVGLVVLFGGSVWLASTMANSAQVEMSEGAVAVVEEKSYDWGEIKIDGGIVEKVFLVKNEGDEVLKLFNVETSCVCTTAQMAKGEQTSPVFGMHDKSQYVLEVDPGETVDVLVKFDPMFHGPNGVGPISRTVTIETNDVSSPKLSWMLTAMVVR